MIQPTQPVNKIALASPGKINLHLAVGEKRADGFHEIDSIMAALDFSDSIVFSFLSGNEAKTALNVTEDGPFLEQIQKGQLFPPLPAEKNIVYRAVELFRTKTGLKTNLSIELIKRIPPGSGLGGGSSNAAAALLALNKMTLDCGKTLSEDVLLELAAQLGCDVPFFIEIAVKNPEKSPARIVSGRGEIFHFLPPPPPLGILLAFPGFPSHTGAAFDFLDAQRLSIKNMNSPKKRESFIKEQPTAGFAWTPPEKWDFFNDFQELFTSQGTEKDRYLTILDDFRQMGAVFAGLSGSGSACFGIFPTEEDAEKAGKSRAGSFYVLKSTFFLRFN